MILRRATEADARVLFEWRNDPVTRANSRAINFVPWAEHVSWFAASLNRPARELLIGERHKIAVGVVRLDYQDASCELSWTVAPEHRRKGVGLQIGRAAVLRLRPGTIARVEIRAANEASIRIARALGFVEAGRNGDDLISFSL